MQKINKQWWPQLFSTVKVFKRRAEAATRIVPAVKFVHNENIKEVVEAAHIRS